MEEQQFMSEGGIIVTHTRFIVPSQTYAMSGITSVKNSEEVPSKFFPIVCLLIGLISISGAPPVGIFFFLIGILWLIGQKKTYHVLLTTASGEAKALSSQDKQFIGRVIDALNNAIVARG